MTDEEKKYLTDVLNKALAYNGIRIVNELEKENAEIKEMSENRYTVIGKMGTKINTLTFENRELKAKVKTLEDIRGTLNYVIDYQKEKIYDLEHLIKGIKESIQEFEEEEKEEEEENEG